MFQYTPLTRARFAVKYGGFLLVVCVVDEDGRRCRNADDTQRRTRAHTAGGRRPTD